MSSFDMTHVLYFPHFVLELLGKVDIWGKE